MLFSLALFLCGHGVSFNGPFHTENSSYVSFKTFYSIIYTFKIIICNCPSCHIRPVPPLESVVGWLTWFAGKTGGHGTNQGHGGATVTNNHFAYPSHFPCFLGQEEVNRKPKVWEPFTFGSEVWHTVVGCPSVGLVRARQTRHRFVSAHGTWSLYTR